MDELLKDLEGLEWLREVYYDGYCTIVIGMRLACDECKQGNQKAVCRGDCKAATLRYIAKKLKELGWVKVTRCGECKWWRRNDESQTEGSHLCNCWTSPYNNGMMRSGEFCQEGMLKEGK